MFTAIFTCYAASYKVCNYIPWFSEVKDSNSNKALKQFTRTAARKNCSVTQSGAAAGNCYKLFRKWPDSC